MEDNITIIDKIKEIISEVRLITRKYYEYCKYIYIFLSKKHNILMSVLLKYIQI